MANLQPKVVEDGTGMMKERVDFGPKVTLGTCQQVPKSPQDDAIEIDSVGEEEYKDENDELKEEELPPLDGNNFARAPVRTMYIIIVLVTIQFTFHFVASGLIDSVVTETTFFLRGTIHGAVVGWCWGLHACLLEFFVDRRLRLVEGFVTSVVYAILCTLVALLPSDPPTGFITSAVGGVMLHANALVPLILLLMVKSGWKKLDAIKAMAFFLLNFGNGWIVVFNGVIVMILWPIAISTDGVKQFSGLLLSLNMLGVETLTVQGVSFLLRKFGHWLPGKNRALASWYIMLIHSITEGYKICILLYGTMQNPSDMQWLVSSVFSFGLNILNRTLWIRFLAFRRFGVGFPNCIAYMHQDVKFSFGYPRFGGLLTLLLSRLILNGKGHFYFNATALAVIAFAMASEALEDAACKYLPQWGLAPNWKGVGVEKFLRKLPEGSINRRFKVDQRGVLVMDVPVHPITPLPVVAIANATVFLCFAGLLTLVSMPYVLGVCGEIPAFDLNSGFGPLMENGALFWPLRSDITCAETDSR